MKGQNKTNEVIFSRKKHTFSKIIYFIFVGLWASIINIIVGIILFCTLIFIPFGIMIDIAAAWVAIASNLAAGYFSSIFIPAYRHTFVCQTKCMLFAWNDVLNRIIERK